jgi:hypothetical protein
MPRIPVYQSNVRQTVTPSVSLQTRSASPSAAGVIEARSKQQSGEVLQRFGAQGAAFANTVEQRERREQDKYDNAYSRQKGVSTADWATQYYRNATNTFRGGKAKDDGNGKSVYDNTGEAFEKYYKETTKDMTPEQLRYYQPQYDSIRSTFMSKADAYVARQVDEYNINEKEASIRSNEDLTLQTEDPNVIAENIADIELDIRDLYRGQSKPFIDEKVLNSKTRIHGGKIDKYLGLGETTKALEYYKKNSVNMTENAQTLYNEKLEAAALNDHVQHQTDLIEFDMLEGVALEENLERADTLSVSGAVDEELRAGVKKELKARDTERKQVKKQAEDRKYNNAIDFILDVEGPTRESKYQASEKFINANFRGKDRKNLLSMAKSQHRGTGDVVTNLEEYQKLSAMAAGDKDKFLKTNIIRDYGHQLSSGDAKSFIKTQEAMRADRGAYSIDSRITLSAGEIGAQVDPDNKEESSEKFRIYKDSIERRVKDLELKTGKNAGIDEINEIIKDVQLNYKLREVESGELKGDLRRRISFGYGPDVDIEKALQDPTGLPDVTDDRLREELAEALAADGQFEVNETTIRLLARIKLGGAYTEELKELIEPYRIK